MTDHLSRSVASSYEPDASLVDEITSIVRTADAQFQADGGSSRHWVRNYFLPMLHEEGWEIRRADALTSSVHQRARNEAIAVIDSERQRLACTYEETANAPVRESIARRVGYLGDLMDRLIGWRHD